MKKYSSYTDLKISKGNPYDTKSPKAMLSPANKKSIAFDLPVMLISKDAFPIPFTTKYSAGYLQRKKIFSSKKQPREVKDLKREDAAKENQTANIIEKNFGKGKVQSPNSRRDNSKQKGSSFRKQKPYIDLNDPLKVRQERMEVQSPKGCCDIWEGKAKQKVLQKQKQKVQKQIEKEKDKSQKNKQKQKKSKGSSTTTTVSKVSKKEKGQKKDEQKMLNEFVYKYEPNPKGLLSQCTSNPNLARGMTFQTNNNNKKGYYIDTVHNAYFSNKPSSFNQLVKNHLTTSIDFLSYAKRNKNFVPKKCESSVILPATSRKTVIFDLDETLIHCNQSVDMPHDVALDIKFPNNTQIRAGINVRPYAKECLRELSQIFEVIVFTASHQCYANVIIDYLDPERKHISHRLFRDHCFKTEEGFYVKDLRILNRDLSNVLLIDNAAYSYSFQPENGVPIVPFYNNKADWELKFVTAYLKDLANVKSLRTSNDQILHLSEYHKFREPRELINQLYM